MGLLNFIIIFERYFCWYVDVFYGLDNDFMCLKCCLRWVIVFFDLYFGDNCLLGSRDWLSFVNGLYGEELVEEMVLFFLFIFDLIVMVWFG